MLQPIRLPKHKGANRRRVSGPKTPQNIMCLSHSCGDISAAARLKPQHNCCLTPFSRTACVRVFRGAGCGGTVVNQPLQQWVRGGAGHRKIVPRKVCRVPFSTSIAQHMAHCTSARCKCARARAKNKQTNKPALTSKSFSQLVEADKYAFTS